MRSFRSPRAATAVPTLAETRLEDVIVLGLAATRLARLVSVDEITGPLRRAVKRRLPVDDPGAVGTAGRLVADGIECPVCVGWWASLLLSLSWPGARKLRRGAAVAGAQVLLCLAERLVSEQGRAAVHTADLVADAAESTGAAA